MHPIQIELNCIKTEIIVRNTFEIRFRLFFTFKCNISHLTHIIETNRGLKAMVSQGTVEEIIHK